MNGSKFLLFLMLLLCTHEAFARQDVVKKKYQYKLAVTATFRDEAPYIKEWIEYHKLVGVQHFYLFNNRSKDHYLQVLEPYVKKGEVELIEWPYASKDVYEWSRIQRGAYEYAVGLSEGIAQWLAIIDLDEFIVPQKHNSLVTLLKDYEDFGGVCINWQMFGTSHIKKISSNKLLIESLVMKGNKNFSENGHVKTIVQPEAVESIPNPHFVNYKKGLFQVNTNKEQFKGPISPYITTDIMCINHYWTRDEEYYYRAKLKRRALWFLKGQEQKAQEERLLNLNAEQDDTILRFVPALRKAMKKSA